MLGTSTLHGKDGSSLRMDLLQRLRHATRADAAIFCRHSYVGDTPYIGTFDIAADCDTSALRALEGQPAPGGSVFRSTAIELSIRKGAWKLSDAAPLRSRSFRALDEDYYRAQLYLTPYAQHALVPSNIGDQLQLLPRIHSRSLGWLALWRRGLDERFSIEARAHANEQVQEIHTTLLAALALEAQKFAPEYVVLDSQGRVARCSETADAWLSRPRREVLRAMVRNADRSRFDAGVVDDVQVRLVRLTGASHPEYLAVLNVREEKPYTTLPQLSSAQQRVAELAGEGAHVNQIAKTLDISVNTVKFHLKKVYSLWNLRSRLDLKWALAAAKLSRQEADRSLSNTEQPAE